MKAPRAKVTIEPVGVLEIDGKALERCRELTYEKGLMRRCIDELRDQRPERAERSLVLPARDENGTILGWALLFENRFGRVEAYYYVDPDHRRSGIGTRLGEEVRRLRPRHKVLVRPYDGASYAFFANFPRFVPQGSAHRLGELRKAAEALGDERPSPVSG